MTTELDDIDFAQLIGDRDIDLCELIERMSEWGIARALYYYALDDTRKRWLEAEPYIKKDARWAHLYARHIIKGGWPEAEPYIMKDSYSAFCYARDIIKGRWPEAEPYIKKDPDWAHCYSDYFG